MSQPLTSPPRLPTPTTATPSPPTKQPTSTPTSAPTDQTQWWELSMILKNTGSVARDHLASERTFLAWMRTSVSLAMAGVAVAQLFTLSRTTGSDIKLPTSITIDPTSPNAQAQRALLIALTTYYTGLTHELEATNSNKRFAKPLGGLLISAGICTMLIGLYRYFLTQHLLTRDQYSATRGPVFLVAALTGSIIVVVFGCLMGSAR